MTLEETIKHAEEVMVENLEKTKDRNASDPIAIKCSECAEEHRQLAGWLKDYKRLLKQEPCEDVISRQAVDKLSKELVHTTRDKADFLCNFWEGLQKLPPVTPQTKWTPVSEGLPESFRFVNCTCHSLIDDREDWVVETCYLPQPKDSPYSDWGNIPMLNAGDCEVVAWMYRDIPEPYKAESEDKE